MKRQSAFLIASLWLGLAVPALALAGGSSAEHACAQLVKAALVLNLTGIKAQGAYYCERQDEASAHYVFPLRWRGDGLPATGSNLVGYYLVEPVSGAIHAWDLGESKRGEALRWQQ